MSEFKISITEKDNDNQYHKKIKDCVFSAILLREGQNKKLYWAKACG